MTSGYPTETYKYEVIACPDLQPFMTIFSEIAQSQLVTESRKHKLWERRRAGNRSDASSPSDWKVLNKMLTAIIIFYV